MNDKSEVDMTLWEPLDNEAKDSEKVDRKSLTFLQDAWRRLLENKIAICSLIIIIIILLGAIFVPMFWHVGYSDQNLEFANVPPTFEIFSIDDEHYVYISLEHKVLEVTKDGVLLNMAELEKDDIINRKKYYSVAGKNIVVDYSKYFLAKKDLTQAKIAAQKDPTIDIVTMEAELEEMPKSTTTCDGAPLTPAGKVWNKTFIFGNDSLGRDLFIRIVYGARISLTVGFAAAFVCFVVGVAYGGISGYIGGRIDNLMMRIVDTVSSIPTLLYVILLSVLFNSGGLFTIVLTIGLTYWVSMARLVRGQVLTLKEQEFILAAESLGA